VRPGARTGNYSTRLEVRDKDGSEPTVFQISTPEITIGRVQGNDIVLPRGNVSKRHARIVIKDGKYIIVDLKSTNGTYVNGRKITSPLVFKPEDKIYIGDFTLLVGELDDDFEQDTVEVDATELRLLAGIAQRDEASRLVYADWLEGNGDLVRAEFLRMQEQLVVTPPDDGGFAVLSDKLRHLAHSIDVKWRYKVARPLIENCLAVEFECPKDWGSLATTEFSDIRYCGACAKRVYYCHTVDDARRQAGRGNCVAVDIVQLRRPGDLEAETERHMTMGVMLPYRP
jgi:uncharacterized protein (TIGR02996 family)